MTNISVLTVNRFVGQQVVSLHRRMRMEETSPTEYNTLRLLTVTTCKKVNFASGFQLFNLVQTYHVTWPYIYVVTLFDWYITYPPNRWHGAKSTA